MATATTTIVSSVLNLLNPLHYVNLIVETPKLVLNTIQTIATTAHEVKYQSPVDAIKNITNTVTNTIGNIASAVLPGSVGQLIGNVAGSVGATIGNVAEAVASPSSIPEAVSNAASAIIQGAVVPIVETFVPAPASQIVGGIAMTVDSTITATTNLVSSLLGGNPLSLIGSLQGTNISAGRAGDDEIVGGDRGDLLYGEGGNDIIAGGGGNDIIYGGSGNDTISGDAGNDKLHGGMGDDVLYGGEGDDVLYGEAGNDQLVGDVGNDKLYGGAGNDVLYGGEGSDLLNGGTGDDVYLFQAGSGLDTIYEEGGASDGIWFSGLGQDAITGIARSGQDLVVSYGDSDALTVTDYFVGSNHRVEYFTFDTDGDAPEIIAVADLLEANGIVG